MRFDNFGFIMGDRHFPKVFQLVDMGIEERNGTEYVYNNRQRPLYSGYVFQYSLQGEGSYEFEGTHYRVPQGSGFFTKIPENSTYGLMEPPKIPWVFMYIHFDGSGVEEFYRYYLKRVGPVCQLPIYSEPIQIFLELHDALCKGKELMPIEGSERVARFLHQLLEETGTSKAKLSDGVRRGLTLLDEQIEKSEGIDQVAMKLGISHAHFTRQFKREMDMTPIDYLRKKRLQKGIYLLLNTNDSVEAIALQCGFTCGNYFSKVFHRKIGMNPMTYRRLHR